MPDEVSEGTDERSAAMRIAGLVAGAGVEIFRDEEEEAYAIVRLGKTRQAWPLKSRKFRALCRGLYHAAEKGRTPGSNAVEEAVAQLEARALMGGDQRAT